jgi:hypothetical protein
MKSMNFKLTFKALQTGLMGGHLVTMAPVPAPKSIGRDVSKDVHGDRATEAACQRERARCQAILSAPEAAIHPALAKGLAFGTGMTRKEALRTLAYVTTTKDFAHLEGRGRQIQQAVGLNKHI